MFPTQTDLPPDQRQDTLPIPAPSELDLSLGAAIPNEDAAWTAYNDLKKQKAAGLALDPVASKTWSTYRDTAKQYGRAIFPKQTAPYQAAVRENTNRILGGLDKLTENLPPEQSLSVQARLKAFPESERPEELARTANYALFQQQYGQKFKPEAYPAFRDQYARQVLGLTDTSDTAVYTELKKRNDEKLDADKNLEADMQVLGYKAIAGMPIDLKAHEEQYKKLFSPAIAEAASLEMRNRIKQARLIGKSVEPIAKSLYDFIAIEGGRADATLSPEEAANAAKGMNTLGEAAARFDKLTDEQKDAVNIYVMQRMGVIGDDPAPLLERLYKKFGLAGEDLGRSAGNFVNRATLSAAGGDMDTNQPANKKWEDWIQNSGFLRAKGRKVKDLTNSTDGWTSLSALALAEQLPYMVSLYAGPAGEALAASSMAGQSYEQARLRNPEANDTAQFATAAVSGAAQAFIEKKSSDFALKALGAVPGFRSTFGKKFGSESFMRLVGLENKYARAAAGGILGGAAVAGVEYSEEVAQDVVDRTLQDLASIPTGVTDDNGNYTTLGQNIGQVLKSWDPRSEQGSKMLLTLLPFMIIGAGGGSFSSFSNGVNLKKNRAALQTLGVPENIIQEITTTPDIARADQLLQQAVSTELNTLTKDAAALRSKDLADFSQTIEDAWNAQGIQILNPTFDEAGTLQGVELHLPNEVQQHPTVEAAQQALSDWTQEAHQQMLESGTEAATAATVDFFTEPGQINSTEEAGTRIVSRDFEGTFSEMLKRGLATSDQLKARLQAFAHQEGISMVEAVAAESQGKIKIRARNFAEEVGKSSWRYTVELFRGADPINAAEDFAEVFWKHAVNNSILDPNKAISWVRSVEDKTGNAYLAENFEYDQADNSANLPFWEALSAMSKEYMLHNYRAAAIPSEFKNWIETMLTTLGTAWEWFKSMMRGRDLQDAIENKVIPQQFAELIADSVGLNEKSRERRVMERESQQARADWENTGYKLSEWIVGKLLHPTRAALDGNPLEGELRKIYDGLTTYKRNANAKVGQLKMQKKVLKAEMFFAGRNEKVNLDNLRGAANELGFNFENISDMLDAVEDAIFFGRETYTTNAGIMQESFSVGRTSITPDANTQIFQGAEGSPTVIGPVSFSISAHHGTPHKVDKFSIDKIGTGEGAQAFGWGLYFAEGKEVAEQYRKNLATRPPSVSASKDPAGWVAYQLFAEIPEADIAEGLKLLELPDTALIDGKKRYETHSKQGNLYTVTLDVNDEDLLDWDLPLSEQSEKVKIALGYDETATKRYQEIQERLSALQKEKSGLDSPEWNSLVEEAQTIRSSMDGLSPLDSGSELYSAALTRVGATGAYLTKNIAATFPDAEFSRDGIGAQEKASRVLNSIGIKGIRYLDGNSRNSQGWHITPPTQTTSGKWMVKSNDYNSKGMHFDTEEEAQKTLEEKIAGSTYNYVMFDDSLITITEENGKVVDMKENQSFSLSRDTQHNLQTVIEARLSRGPQERVAILETMRERLQGLTAKLEARNAGDLTPMEKQLLGWRGKDLTPAQAERLRIEDALATVKGIVSALPVEIRSKVSVPLTRILDADSDVKTYNAFRTLIQNADEVIEEELKETYTDRIATLLDTARPTSTESRTNKTLLTPDTQRALDQIDIIVDMSDADLMRAEITAEADLQELEAQVLAAQADGDTELAKQLILKQIDAQQYMLALGTYGKISSQSSTELARTYQQLKDLYIKGRQIRKMLDEAERNNNREIRDDLKSALGYPNGVSGPAHDRATDATRWKSVKQYIKAIGVEHMNFHEFMEVLFPDSLTVRDWSTRAVKAMRSTKRRRLDAEKRYTDFLSSRLDVKGHLATTKLLDALSTRKTRSWSMNEVVRRKKEAIPIEYVPQILNGKMNLGWTNDILNMTLLKQAWRDFQMLPAKKRERTKNLTLMLPTERRLEGSDHKSDLELLDVLMTYEQESYRPALDQIGYTEDVIKQIKSDLDPRTLAIWEHLKNEYASGWNDMNRVFQRVFKMDMPQIRNYAPGTFENTKIDNGKEAAGSLLGSTGATSAMGAGATKNRRAHTSRPLTISALSKYWAHTEQTAYWMEWTELIGEVARNLRSPDVRRAIEARHGKKVASDVNLWIDMLNNDGAATAQGIIGMEKWIATMINTQSHIALAYNLSVPFKQASAALGALTLVPAGSAIKTFAKILFRWNDMKKIFKSEAIQQRIRAGISPESKALMDATRLSPSRLMDLLSLGQLHTSLTDAAFTTISGMIAYDYHLSLAKKQGLTGEAAENFALEKMDYVIARTSQPADTQMKSLIELKAGHGLGKLMVQFKSDPRRAMGSILAALYKRKQGDIDNTELSRIIFTNWVAYGILGQLGTSMFKTLAHDEDDTRDNWEWENFALAAILGPIEGLFLFGTVASTVTRKLAGMPIFSSTINPLDKYVQGGLNVLNKEDSDITDMLTEKAFLDLIGAAGGASGLPGAAIIPALVRAADQLANIADNAVTSPEEQLAKWAQEFDTQTADQSEITQQNLDEVYQRALSADPSKRDSILAEITDEKDRRRIREKIQKQQQLAGMNDLEKDLANLSKTRRAEKAKFIFDRITNTEQKEAFQNRMKILFDIAIE